MAREHAALPNSASKLIARRRAIRLLAASRDRRFLNWLDKYSFDIKPPRAGNFVFSSLLRSRILVFV
jgi:hypothetical protein